MIDREQFEQDLVGDYGAMRATPLLSSPVYEILEDVAELLGYVHCKDYLSAPNLEINIRLMRLMLTGKAVPNV